MKVDFDCPTCGSKNLIEVRNNIQTESSVVEIDKIGEEIDICSDMVDMDFGDLVCYMCENCEDKIEDENGNAVLSAEELFNWLDKNKMLKGA